MATLEGTKQTISWKIYFFSNLEKLNKSFDFGIFLIAFLLGWSLHCTIIFKTGRSSRPEVFCKKDFLKNFTKFTGKHLCQSLFFYKVAGLMAATLLKTRLWHKWFPVNFVKFLRTPFYIEHLWWLLLNRRPIQYKCLNATLVTRQLPGM